MTATLVGTLSLRRDGGESPPARGPVAHTIESGPLAVTTEGPASITTVDGVAVALLGGLTGSGDPDAIGSAAVLAAQWQRHGDRCLARLRGEWLAVVWDSRTGTLTCARSARGFRRLFWQTDGRVLRFATGLGDLLPPGAGNRRLDEGFLAEMLVNTVTTHSGTPFVGVYRLPGGHLLEAGPTLAPRVRRWLAAEDSPDQIDAAEAVPELRRRLEAVLADHVTGDGGRAGVFVSGGIDSNAVLAVARQATDTVVGCSWVFPGQPHDESSFLDALDSRSADPVWRFHPREYEWDRWRRWSRTSLEPPLRPNVAMSDAMIPLLATAGVSRMMTGEGGDDWFGGGPMHWPALVRQGRLPTLVAAARRDHSRLRPTAGRLWHSALEPLVPGIRRPAPPAWIGAEFARRVHLTDRMRAAKRTERRAAADPVQARLARVSRPSHAWQYEGVRSRFAAGGVDWCHPLHDRRIIDLVLGLPGDAVWRAGETKSLLRAAVADLVPEQIVRRQSKSSFEAPIIAAIRSCGGVATLVGHPLVTEGYVDLPALRELERDVLARQDAGLSLRTHGKVIAPLWNVLSTATWMSEVSPT
jgi:asparagine synthase (glutamine-hydrolysing)